MFKNIDRKEVLAKEQWLTYALAYCARLRRYDYNHKEQYINRPRTDWCKP